MPKRPDTHATVLLALELLRRIPRGRKVTASELHGQLTEAGFIRELRTIQKQLGMLASHFDIECDRRNKPFGYSLKPGSAGFAVSALGEQESLLLTLAEQHLRNLLPAALIKSMEGFFQQARTSTEPNTRPKLAQQWLSKVRVVSETQPLLPPELKPGVLDAVSRALYGNQWLTIDYRKANGESWQRNVMPLGLAQQGPRLYLVGRYENEGKTFQLALHRMQSAHATTLSFVRPKDFDLQKYDEDEKFGFGEGKRIRLHFTIDKEVGSHLLETPLSKDQTVKDLGDQLRISATVVDSARLDWWLRGFGDTVDQLRKIKIR